jgi:hypothetical protein
MGLRFGRGFLNMMANVGSDMSVLLFAQAAQSRASLYLVRCSTANDGHALQVTYCVKQDRQPFELVFEY